MAGLYTPALLFLVISACHKHALSLTRSDFYSLAGEEILNLRVGDEVLEEIPTLNPQFFFYGSNYSDLFVSCIPQRYQKWLQQLNELVKIRLYGAATLDLFART